MVATRRQYVPDRGDTVWLDLDPTRGHEQRGRRPALVVTPQAYNRAAGLALVCPITSAVKGYPFEITLSGKKIGGVVLVDQIRAVDWSARTCTHIGKAPASVVLGVQRLLSTLVLG